MIRKIVKVIEPHKNDRSFYGGLYGVYFEGFEDQRTDMFAAQFRLRKFQSDLLEKGFDVKVLEELEQLMSDFFNAEQSLGEESY